MKKEKPEFHYEIEDIVGIVKESEKNDWVKAVLRVAWGDNPSCLDIRNINLKDKRLGKGISLSNEDCDRLVSILLENDFGTLDELEAAIQRKRSFFTVIEESLNEDEPLRIDINL